MKHLPILLLTLSASSAFGDELRIDPARLQEQVQQRSEQAAQQGGAPSAPAVWLSEPAATAQAHGQGGMGQGYGRGYENRYGQRAAPAGTGSDSPMSGAAQGAGHGMGGGGRGRH